MKKKIIFAVVAVLVVALSITFGYFLAKNSQGGSERPSVDVGVSDTSNEEKSTGESALESKEETESEASDENLSANKNDLQKMILGQWTDNANFSGYEFMEDGIMKATYFNMELLELDDVISGTYTGTYTLEKNKLTVSYTIYSKAVVKTYTVKAEENTLTLTDEKGESAIYVKKGAVSKMDNVDKKLLGSWKSNLNGYEFKDTGVVAITFIDLSSMGITLPISGTVDGVYTLDGDKLTVKYSIYTGVIEKNFKYKIDGKVLTLTDLKSGDMGTYIKSDE